MMNEKDGNESLTQNIGNSNRTVKILTAETI